MSFKDVINSLLKPAPALPDTEDIAIDDVPFRKQFTEEAEAELGEAPKLRRRLGGCVELSDERYQGENVSSKDLFGDSSDPRVLTANNVVPSSDEDEGTDDEVEVQEDGSSREEESDEELEEGEESEEEDSDDGRLDSARVMRKLREQQLASDGDSEEVSSGEEMDDEDDDDEAEVPKKKAKLSKAQLAAKGARAAALRELQEEEEALDDEEEEDGGVAMLEESRAEAEGAKAKSVRVQKTIYEQLLYLKIKMNAAMRFFNELPRGQLAKTMLKEADPETRKNMVTAYKNSQKIIARLLEAEEQLLRSSTFTQEILQGKQIKVHDDDEITSEESVNEDESGDEEGTWKRGRKGGDEDDEMEEDEEEGGGQSSANKTINKAKNYEKMYPEAINKKLEKNYRRFNAFRRETLRQWDNKTRLHGAVKNFKKKAGQKFGEDKASLPALKRIDDTLKERGRLIRRTRIRRSNAGRIGDTENLVEDSEMFDDHDFYFVLLNDLLEKNNTAFDPVAMARSWIEINKAREFVVKKSERDNTGNKDRKIRYVVIPKLVNFHPAAPESVPWQHENRNELFKSLFAK